MLQTPPLQPLQEAIKAHHDDVVEAVSEVKNTITEQGDWHSMLDQKLYDGIRKGVYRPGMNYPTPKEQARAKELAGLA